MAVMEVYRSAHPRADKLRKLAQGRLAVVEATAIEEHLADCESCCRLVEETPDDSFVGKLRDARELPSTETLFADTTLFQQSEEPAELVDHPRYRLGRLLGRGGMGAVYLANHRHMGRPVALKVVNSELLNQPGALARFHQEARAAAKLDHPNIVAAYDADQAGKVHFLVMEYVEGQNLAEYLRQHGSLPIAQACDIVRQAALGLHHAHERGMVHRDIKPHNLMLTPTGQVKVLDFGLARLAAEPLGVSGNFTTGGQAQLTGAGAVIGSADYIAPEQARDAHAADGRSDIYSLGCTLYQLLTNQLPFPDGTAPEKLECHSAADPRGLALLRPEIPNDLNKVVTKMIAKRPEDRFQTAAEVAATLARFALGKTPGRLRFRLRTAVAALVFGVFSVAAAAGVVRISSGDREIVIQTDDPSIEVVVKDDKIVRIVDPKTGKAYQLDRSDLTLSLADEPNGLAVTLDGGRPVTLKREGTRIATVRVEKSKAHQRIQDKVAEQLKLYREFQKEGKYKEALAAARKAKELDPDSLSADAAIEIAKLKIAQEAGNQIYSYVWKLNTLKAADVASAVSQRFRKYQHPIQVISHNGYIEVQSTEAGISEVQRFLDNILKDDQERGPYQTIPSPPAGTRAPHPVQTPAKGFNLADKIPPPPVVTGARPIPAAPRPVKAGEKGDTEPLVEVEVHLARVRRDEAKRLAARWRADFGKGTRDSDSEENGMCAVVRSKDLILKDLADLHDKNLASMMFEPTVAIVSGCEGRIRAGGTVPFVTTSSAGTRATTQTPYGIDLRLRPSVLHDGTIELELRPELNLRDASVGIDVKGKNSISIPGRQTRRIQTTVRISSGSTLVTGGTLENRPGEVECDFVLLVTPRVIPPRSEKRHVQLDVNVIRLKAADAKRVWPETAGKDFADNTSRLKTVFQRHDGSLSLAELRKKGLANVVFNQRLITLSGHTADIVSGGQVPVLAKEESGSRFSFVPVGTMLKVMAYVTDNDRVRLAIDLAVTKVDNSTGSLIPDTQNAKTVVELQEGQLFALGGFLENDEESIILITPRLVDPEVPPPASSPAPQGGASAATQVAPPAPQLDSTKPIEPKGDERMVHIDVAVARVRPEDARRLSAQWGKQSSNRKEKQPNNLGKERALCDVVRDKEAIEKALKDVCASVQRWPAVVTKTGRTAWIVSGGETPLPPVLSEDGSPSASYKMFGLILKCCPTVQRNGRIQLQFQPELSALDESAGVNLGGREPISAPGFRTQTTEATVEMDERSTLVISGIVDKSCAEDPLELIFLVTPRAVDPSLEVKNQVQIDVAVARVDREDAKRMWQSTAKMARPIPTPNGKAAFVGKNESDMLEELATLRDKGRAQLLHRRIIIPSGQPGHILDGGETPIVTASSKGTRHVFYKTFGTIVNCFPIILNDGRIHLEVRPEISKLDPALGISLASATGTTTVPGFDVRTTQAALDAEDGETIAIGGIVEDNREVIILVTPRVIPETGSR